jgi:uncharacterized membrane protein YgcG
MFINAEFSKIDNYVSVNTVTYPGKFSAAALAANPVLAHLTNANLTQYLNTDGYYSATGQFLFSKPWQERKYTLIFTGNVSYTNYVDYSSSVDSNNVASTPLKNIAKALTLTPGMRFRLDILNVIDAQASGNFAMNRTSNSVSNSFFDANTNTRTLTMDLNGKNYFFNNWTWYYDYTKQENYGYASSVHVTNPNILSTYVERRFLKNNRATIRLAAYDLLNQNTGFTTTTNGNSITQTNTNRLGRYYMLTFTLRLQKFAGRAPTQDGDRRGGDRGNRQGGFGGGPGGGGPGGGGGFGGGGPQ